MTDNFDYKPEENPSTNTSSDPVISYGDSASSYAPYEPAPSYEESSPTYGNTSSNYAVDMPHPDHAHPASYNTPVQSYGQSGLGGYATEHPSAQTVLILSIVGFFVTICAFIAWYLGSKAKKEIQAGAPYVWGGSLQTGYMIGKILSILSIVAVGFLIVIFILFPVMAAIMGS